ncbi:F-box protein At5g07610-like, partial [Bidens hawaiensis]|uniref:F-box protein At5g07610-like n=1 Tax=Bidens hawaiensis TaxID=980011 RepID=UPI0040499694
MKQASDLQSAARVASSNDLLTEILIRLPVKSVLRLKSVSKHWLWLLTHKDFTNRYDKYNLSESAGLFGSNLYISYNGGSQRTLYSLMLKFCVDRHGIRIAQSCNGLLLCCSDRCNNSNDRGARKYYVFNPTTKQFAVIPSVLGGDEARKSIWFMGLAYHPRNCVHYKLVCIRILEPRTEYLFQIQIYSSETRMWKISVESFSPNRPFYCQDGVYWNGAIYWAPSKRNHMYFKLDVEQLQTLPLTEEMMMPSEYDYCEVYLGESRGHLHLTVYRTCPNYSSSLNVYEMLSDHSGRFVKYQIQLDGIASALPKFMDKRWHGYVFGVIDVVRGEEEEGAFVV